jgi:GNAT superfamily N-acetyltransferase
LFADSQTDPAPWPRTDPYPAIALSCAPSAPCSGPGGICTTDDLLDMAHVCAQTAANAMGRNRPGECSGIDLAQHGAQHIVRTSCHPHEGSASMAIEESKPANRVTWLAEPQGDAAAEFDVVAHWHETLRDGTQVLIRPIGREDAALERAFTERLSPTSRQFRFLGQPQVDDRMIRRLTDIDYRRDMAFIALHHEAGGTREVGVSRFCLADDGKSCECAVVVDDAWHGRGLGYLLMRHLIDVARRRGIKRMFSIDLAGNQEMRKLATSLGFQSRIDPDSPGEVTYSLDL